MRKTLLMCLITLMLIGSAPANPGISVTATAVDNSGLPGETATFDVSIMNLDEYPKIVQLSIPDMTPSWSYTLNPPVSILAPSDTASSDLAIDIPPSATPGTYPYTLYGEEYGDLSAPVCLNPPDMWDPLYEDYLFLCLICPYGAMTPPCSDSRYGINVVVEGGVSAPELPLAVLIIAALAPAFSYLLVKRG